MCYECDWYRHEHIWDLVSIKHQPTIEELDYGYIEPFDDRYARKNVKDIHRKARRNIWKHPYKKQEKVLLVSKSTGETTTINNETIRKWKQKGLKLDKKRRRRDLKVSSKLQTE